MADPAPSLSRNLVANFGGYFVSVVVALFLSPVIIGNLGDERYGVWSLVGELVGYYAFLDLGIRSAVSHYVARYAAGGDPAHVRSTSATAFWVLTGLGVLAVIAGVGLTLLLPYLFDTGGVEVGEARAAMLIMSLTIGCNLPAAVFSAVLVGSRRLDIVNAIEASTRVASAGVIYWAMTNGGGLVALAAIQAATLGVTWAITVQQSRRVEPQLSLRPEWFRRGTVRELLGFGLKNFAINLALLVIDRTDLIVVGIFLGVKWVTFYAIGAALVTYAWTACSALTQSFTPHLTRLHATGRQDELERMYLTGTRLVGLFASTLFACLCLLASSFIALWLGDVYVTGDIGWRSDTIVIVLALANLPRVYQSISWQLLFAARLQRRLMWIMIAEAIGNLVLSLVLVQRIGPVGVAIGTLVPCFVSHVFVLPAYVLFQFRIGPGRYLREGLGRPLLVGALLYLAGRPVVGALALETWPSFLLAALGCGSAGVLLSLAIGVSREERGWALRRLRSR